MKQTVATVADFLFHYAQALRRSEAVPGTPRRCSAVDSEAVGAGRVVDPASEATQRHTADPSP
jgi:hypothetical protein